jgi:hypothetical protein
VWEVDGASQAVNSNAINVSMTRRIDTPACVAVIEAGV